MRREITTYIGDIIETITNWWDDYDDVDFAYGQALYLAEALADRLCELEDGENDKRDAANRANKLKEAYGRYYGGEGR